MKKRFIFTSSVLSLVLLLSGCGSSSQSTDSSASAVSSSTPSTSAQSSVSAESSAPTQAQVKSPWKVINEMNITQPTHYLGFFNENYGITVGANGECHFTQDGGKTWPAGENKSACRFGLDIVSEKIAWNCGNSGNVRVTLDGGKTWKERKDFGDSEPNTCKFISFLDDKTGWIAANAKFAATTDGAKTWNESKLPEGISEVAALYRRTQNDGYILDTNGTLVITADGGKTWTKSDLGFAKLNVVGGKINGDYVPHAAMRFTDAQNGVIAISIKDNEGWKAYIMKTSDAGKTWSETPLQLSKDLQNPLKVYLSKDAKILTLANSDNYTAILKEEQ